MRKKNYLKFMHGIKDNRFIYSLLLLALILRLPAMWDGLPAVYNSTEYFLAKIALNMGARLSLDPLIYVYPTFYSYLLLGLYGCYYLFGKLIGLFSDRTAFAVQFLVQPSNFYLLGRAFNLVISLLCIYVMYRILEKYRGKFFAGLAASMAVLSQSYIEFSGYAVPDTLLIFFSTMIVLFFIILDRSPRTSYFFWQGLCCGLAIAVKYNAGFFAIGLLISNYILFRKYNLNFVKIMSVSIAGIIGGFLLTNPMWVVIPGNYINGFRYRTGQMGVAVSFDYGLNYIWELSHLLSQEWVIGFVFITGTIFVICKQPKQFIPELTVLLLTFLYVGSWKKKGLDYLYVLFPIWIIFGTVWVEQMYHKFFKKEVHKKILIVAILFPSLLLSFYHDILYLRQDTREEATRWLIDYSQPGQKYCYDYYHIDLGVFDINRYVEYGAGAVYLPAVVKQKLEQYRSYKENISFIPIMYQISNPDYSGTNLYEKDESNYKRKDLECLQAEGVHFLITNKLFYSTYQRVQIENYPPLIAQRIKEIRDFYNLLETNYEPIKIFKPGFWNKGPELKVYDLSKSINHSTAK
jgi:hypothetical protein